MRITDSLQMTSHDFTSRRQFLIGALAGGAFLTRWSWCRAGQITSPPFILEWGEHGKGPGEFDACVGIAIGKHDEVYTAEFRNQRVQRFTPDGTFLGQFTTSRMPGA